MIDTKKARRRDLRFHNLSDLEREVERLAAGERAGRLACHGNWTLGQALGHLAAWMDYFYIGFPMARPSLPIRLIGRYLMKPSFLNGKMPVGTRIPGAKDGTYATDRLSLDEGIARFKAAIGRVRNGEVPVHHSPIFGPLTHDELMRLSMRHAELHLGFFDVG